MGIANQIYGMQQSSTTEKADKFLQGIGTAFGSPQLIGFGGY